LLLMYISFSLSFWFFSGREHIRFSRSGPLTFFNRPDFLNGSHVKASIIQHMEDLKILFSQNIKINNDIKHLFLIVDRGKYL
jgi:hypothetical protein